MVVALAVIPIGGAPAGATDRFGDVPTSDIFHDDITWLGESGITRGCNPPDNDAFCPTDNVTRGQMAAFFSRGLGLFTTTSGADFSDTAGSVFEGDIKRLSAAGITRGCNPPDNDAFCPTDFVTRGQMAAFFVRALGLSNTSGGTDFTDTDGSVFEGDILLLSAAGITAGCNPPDNDAFCPDSYVTREQMAAFFHRAMGANGPLDLTIAHINDHHSHIDAGGATLTLDGQDTDVETGGFARVVTKMNAIAAANDNTLSVHAGDALTGTLFYSLFKGEVDAELMNEICFDVFELGNHEFDDSDANLKQFLDWLAAGGCNTVTLGANVIPAVGTPLAPTTSTDYVQPWTIEVYDGQRVGIVGVDIANKTKNSSSPLDSTEFLDEVATVQSYVDALESFGVDKIVAVTHYQYQNDLALAAAVDGVDVIVGGDSHSLLGSGFTAFGLGPEGEYPTVVSDMAGDDVCVVQAWQYSDVVGQLDVSWDADGTVASCGGNPTLLLGDTFTREVPDPGGSPGDTIDQELIGADLDAVIAEIDATPLLEVVEPDADALAIIDGYRGEVDALSAQVIGTVQEVLCLERIPGQDYRVQAPDCPAGYGALHGGQAQQLVAQAFLARSFEADVALQNSGGVREIIPAGDYSIADAYTLLPFANTMVNIELTGQEIVDSLNEGFSYALQVDGSTGAYPYAAGLRWETNFTSETITSVEIRPRGATDWAPIDLGATYTVVVNSFMASGGDGYTSLATAVADGRSVDTFIDYAQGFIDYVEQDLGGVVGPPTEFSTDSVVGTYTP